MKLVRVCIYGGTDLKGTPSEFVSELSYKILSSFPAIIITGGFLHSHKEPSAISTDVAALNGARRYAEEHNVDLKTCFEAWIPDPILDERPDVDGVERMKENEGITVRVMRGRTPLGRRLAMVAGVDLVVTISGRIHTEVVVEQALEQGIPVFPIPFAGGDSEKLLNKYKQRIAAGFPPKKLEECLQSLSDLFGIDYKTAATEVVKLIKTAKLGKCLVLQPYDEQHNELFSTIIEPTVARHMIPVRLDHLPGSESIYNSFADALRTSTAVIVDITKLNENVMYEVGYAHGLGLKPLLFTREESSRSQLPVYFRTLNVRLAGEETPLKQLIDEYLSSIKVKRGDY
jgi:hypothetical protein